MIEIRRIIKDEEELVATIISLSNSRVLERLKIDKTGWPRHQSNCRKEIITGAIAKGEIIYLAIYNMNIIGTISLKMVGTTVEIKRLSVHPDYQQKGTGTKLLNFAKSFSRNHNAKRLKLGAIEENVELIQWYIKNGFTSKKSKRFKGIPVSILFMELTL